MGNQRSFKDFLVTGLWHFMASAVATLGSTVVFYGSVAVYPEPAERSHSCNLGSDLTLDPSPK